MTATANKMIKSKWLLLSAPVDFDGFYQRIAAQRYTDDTGGGFEIDEYKDDKLSGKYIHKVETREIVIDPFGNENVVPITRYAVYAFSVYKSKSNKLIVNLINPPRSTKIFFTTLYQLFGFGVFVEEIRYPPSEFIAEFKKILKPTKLYVYRAKSTGIPVNENTVISIDAKSNKDAIADMHEILPGKERELSYLLMRIEVGNAKGMIEITKSGLIGFHDVMSDMIDRLVLYKFS